MIISKTYKKIEVKKMNDEWGKGAKYWDRTWNPIIGCKKVSEGCDNCYAASMAQRFPALQDELGGFAPHAPNYLKKPPKSGVVFVGNMTDIFGEWNSDKQIKNWLYGLSMMDNCTNLILTKRAERMAKICWDDPDWTDSHWFGVTAETQARYNERIYACQMMPKSLNRWLSAEPLLGSIRLGLSKCAPVDWVVVGAESGSLRRPCKLEWVAQIVADCREYNIPVFVKQLDIDGKLVKDITKFPPELQIRQVPWKGK